MIVLNSFKGLKNKFHNIVVGIGNFDGVHIGHQKLIKQVINTAKNNEGTAIVMTFDPHPLAVLSPKDEPPKLLSQQAKEKMMQCLGIDALLSIPFNLDFANMTPEQFINDILFEELAVQGIVVGYNYTFGNRGLGDVTTLKKYQEKYGYTLQVIEPVTINDQVVSSTLIRKMLLEGEVEKATKFLGYTPFVEGIVVTGDRRGNTIGFPTANLELSDKLLSPANGVYSVHVEINDDTYLGVANIGTKPTFNGQSNYRNLEVHLLDFNDDIYGDTIVVKFLRRLRNEKRFNSVSDLITQINQDIEMTISNRV
ncbi:bifunctional riboflavin kinase/FAD synthetase [Peptococcaceae bacterium 1198_IL3148]